MTAVRQPRGAASFEQEMREVFSRENYGEFLVSRMQLPRLEKCQVRMVHVRLSQGHHGALSHKNYLLNGRQNENIIMIILIIGR